MFLPADRGAIAPPSWALRGVLQLLGQAAGLPRGKPSRVLRGANPAGVVAGVAVAPHATPWCLCVGDSPATGSPRRILEMNYRGLGEALVVVVLAVLPGREDGHRFTSPTPSPTPSPAATPAAPAAPDCPTRPPNPARGLPPLLSVQRAIIAVKQCSLPNWPSSPARPGHGVSRHRRPGPSRVHPVRPRGPTGRDATRQKRRQRDQPRRGVARRGPRRQHGNRSSAHSAHSALIGLKNESRRKRPRRGRAGRPGQRPPRGNERERG